jgi:hypothetical protein
MADYSDLVARANAVTGMDPNEPALDPFTAAAMRARRGVRTDVRGTEDRLIGPAVGGALTSFADLVERAKQESTSAALGGSYNAKPVMEMATGMLGGGTPFAARGQAGIFGGRLLRLAPDVAAPGTAYSPARFPQYAEQYPSVGPPMPAIDKKTGNEYLAKQLTPEAETFMKERGNIAKTMEREGYTPYYDPTKRTYANPENYPPNVDTRGIIPKKQATIDKHLDTIGAAETRKRLRAAFKEGQKQGNAEDWYAMGQLEADFVKELGEKEGREAFKQRFATSMAATTGGADPTSNLLMSAYGNYLRTKGLPYPGAAFEMPAPVGGRYVTGNMAMHKRFFDEGGFPALGAENPKRHNFAQNFMGNRGVATMDEQMTAGMTPGKAIPPPGTYGLYERVLGEEAKRAGVPPANFQDVAWAGFKGEPGKPMISHVNDMIERTHRLTGMPRKEIVRRGLVRGETPLYGAGGATAAATLGEILAQED